VTEKIYTEENSEYLKNHPTWHIEDSPWKAKQIIKIFGVWFLKCLYLKQY
jgi:hypothetical protein